MGSDRVYASNDRQSVLMIKKASDAVFYLSILARFLLFPLRLSLCKFAHGVSMPGFLYFFFQK